MDVLISIELLFRRLRKKITDFWRTTRSRMHFFAARQKVILGNALKGFKVFIENTKLKVKAFFVKDGGWRVTERTYAVSADEVPADIRAAYERDITNQMVNVLENAC